MYIIILWNYVDICLGVKIHSGKTKLSPVAPLLFDVFVPSGRAES